MSWTTLRKNKTPANQGLLGVHLRIYSRHDTPIRAQITLGKDVTTKMGWHGKQIYILPEVGTGEHAGLLRLVPVADKEAGYSLRTTKGSRQAAKGSPQIDLPPWDGLVREVRERVACKYQVDGDGLVISVPESMRVTESPNDADPKAVPVTYAAAAGPTIKIDEAPPEPEEAEGSLWAEPLPPGSNTDAIGLDDDERRILQVVANGQALVKKQIWKTTGMERTHADITVEQLVDAGLLRRGPGPKLAVTAEGTKALHAANGIQVSEAPEEGPEANTDLPEIEKSFDRQVLNWYCQGVADTAFSLARTRHFHVDPIAQATGRLEKLGYLTRDKNAIVTVIYDHHGRPVAEEAAQ